jgi:hypothetical protein
LFFFLKAGRVLRIVIVVTRSNIQHKLQRRVLHHAVVIQLNIVAIVLGGILVFILKVIIIVNIFGWENIGK